MQSDLCLHPLWKNHKQNHNSYFFIIFMPTSVCICVHAQNITPLILIILSWLFLTDTILFITAPLKISKRNMNSKKELRCILSILKDSRAQQQLFFTPCVVSTAAKHLINFNELILPPSNKTEHPHLCHRAEKVAAFIMHYLVLLVRINTQLMPQWHKICAFVKY